MPTRYGSYLIPRPGLMLALAGLILTIATLWLGAPAAAQFRLGFPIGIGMIAPAYDDRYSPSDSWEDRRSNKPRNARRARSANERHAKVARRKEPAKTDSKPSGAF